MTVVRSRTGNDLCATRASRNIGLEPLAYLYILGDFVTLVMIAKGKLENNFTLNKFVMCLEHSFPFHILKS